MMISRYDYADDYIDYIGIDRDYAFGFNERHWVKGTETAHSGRSS